MTMVIYMKVEHIGAGIFKARCLQLLDEVGNRHLELIITKHGKPLARLIPIEDEHFSLFGCMKNSAVIKGDIVSGTDEEWEADA